MNRTLPKRTPRKPPRPLQKPGNTSTPLKSDDTNDSINRHLMDFFKYNALPGIIPINPSRPNLFTRLFNWIRNLLNADLHRTGEGYFVAKPKRKSKEPDEQMETDWDAEERGIHGFHMARIAQMKYDLNDEIKGILDELNEDIMQLRKNKEKSELPPPPPPPDPLITPTTSKGNYPSKGVDYFVDRENNSLTFVRPLEPGETYGNEIPNPNETEDDTE